VIEVSNSCIEREIKVSLALVILRPGFGLFPLLIHTDKAFKCFFVNTCVCRLTRLMCAPHSHS
jgi:hypothetical protein